jgi:hypothetical protein
MAFDGSSFLRALRRFHAWIGVSGAAFGLLFGLTGILQNHRAVMKIDLGQVEESKVQVELAVPAASPDDLAKALQAQLGTKAVALRQGAAWAIGEGTNGELIVDPELKGVIGPVTGSPNAKRAAAGGRAQVTFAKL